MDFADAPEHAEFRREFRGWLDANLTDDLKVEDASDSRVAPDRETLEKRIAWQKKMYAAGWVGISWPKEYGGRGASFIQQVIFDEEYFRAHAPILPGHSALNLLGPTLIQLGTEAQKQKHLQRILAGEERWCQGFSEPGAGGDLASLRTRAIDAGDHFIVNGQKVWTSGAHFADWCFLLVRTDPEAPKHHGISYLLVDMKTPGITVRPLVLLNKHRHFNEVFFEDVKVPKENLVGQLNEGWKVAITTLMFERGGAGGRDHVGQIARLTELAKQFPSRQEPAWRDSHVRQQLAQLAIDAQALKVTRLRGLTRRLRGEAPGPEGSILKLFGSELATRIADFSGSLLGPYATLETSTDMVPDAPRWTNRVLGSRQYTIAGGTSEIQRNIIGERVLGLPKG
ncbi:MAG TPA: acyl-CoA dehydrogenase family protein [Stellaceae bacterium]|jgi:alkylation response protein AidB-like acyl-CoA dehydrogenase|nr:acyl-CoA dehydrogenase family protein [Stellaceae bacterium]